MPKNRRTTMADIAERNGWRVHENYPAPSADVPDDVEWVAYLRRGEKVLIAWTPERTPYFAAKASGYDAPATVAGHTTLIVVRGWFESRQPVNA